MVEGCVACRMIDIQPNYCAASEWGCNHLTGDLYVHNSGTSTLCRVEEKAEKVVESDICQTKIIQAFL